MSSIAFVAIDPSAESVRCASPTRRSRRGRGGRGRGRSPERRTSAVRFGDILRHLEQPSGDTNYTLKYGYVDQTRAIARRFLQEQGAVDLFADLTAHIGSDLFTVWLPTALSANRNCKALAYEMNSDFAHVLQRNQEKIRDASEGPLLLVQPYVQALAITEQSAAHFFESKELAEAKRVGIYIDFPWTYDKKNVPVQLDPSKAPVQDPELKEATTVPAFVSRLLEQKNVAWVVAKVPPGTSERERAEQEKQFISQVKGGKCQIEEITAGYGQRKAVKYLLACCYK